MAGRRWAGSCRGLLASAHLHCARFSMAASSVAASIHILTLIESVPSSIVYCRLVFCSSARVISPTMVTWWRSLPSTVKPLSPPEAGAFFSCLIVHGASDCLFSCFPCAREAGRG